MICDRYDDSTKTTTPSANVAARRVTSRLFAHRAAIFAVGGFLAFGAGAGTSPSDVAQGRIVALAFDATSQTLFKAYPRALYRRVSDGNWERISLSAAIERGRINAVSTAAHREGVIYIAGLGLGVLRSEDAGKTWAARNAGLPSRDVVAFASHADQPDTVYAYVSGKGIFRSEDAGGHWRLMDAGPREKIVQLTHSNLPGSMQTGWLFAATTKGVERSMDCFCGWRDAGDLARVVKTVAYDPHEPKRVYAAADADLLVSADGGEQWSSVKAPGVDISALAVTTSGTLYAAIGEGALFRSDDHGQTWQHRDD